MRWVSFEGDSCPRCGDDVEVHTECTEDGFFYENELAICVDCGLAGHTVIYDYDNPSVNISWDDFD